MQRSQAIARLAGPVFCAIGIGMLTNRATYRAMAEQGLASYPLIYLSGILLLVCGLTILNTHSDWTADWRSLVTAFGWLMSIAGVFRIIAPQFVVFVGTAIIPHDGFFIGGGIVLLALGGFLIFKSYAA